VLLGGATSASTGALALGGVILALYAVFTFLYDRCISARASWSLLRETLSDIETFTATLTDPAVSQQVKNDIAGVKDALKSPQKWARPWFIPTSRIQALWRRAHYLEIECWKVANKELARERLYGVRGVLSQYSDGEAHEIVHRIDQGKWADRPNELLAEALRISYDRRDTLFDSLANRQLTGAWFTLLGLALIVLAALTYHREPLLVFGALGGLLSRVARLLRRRPSALDYGVSAVLFLLAPVVGALSGWVGVAIVQGMVNLKLLDRTTFGSVWDLRPETTALALAFAFGFVERLIDRVVDSAASVLGGQPTDGSGKPGKSSLPGADAGGDGT